jgi:hypothetical protein
LPTDEAATQSTKQEGSTYIESVKFEFMETIPSNLEPGASARAVEALLEAPADPPAIEDADVNIQSLTRPSTPQVTCVKITQYVAKTLPTQWADL